MCVWGDLVQRGPLAVSSCALLLIYKSLPSCDRWAIISRIFRPRLVVHVLLVQYLVGGLEGPERKGRVKSLYARFPSPHTHSTTYLERKRGTYKRSSWKPKRKGGRSNYCLRLGDRESSSSCNLPDNLDTTVRCHRVSRTRSKPLLLGWDREAGPLCPA